MHKRFKYDELPEGLRKTLMRNLVDRYTLEGRENPAEEAEIKLTKLTDPLKKKAWRFKNLAYMQKIDKKRLELGLKPFHNV